MKRFIVFLALLAGASCGTWKGGLRAKWSIGLIPGKNNFFDIPRSIDAATAQGWVQEARPDDQPLESLVLFCPSPPEVCALYDDTGFSAGLQIAFAKENLTNTKYDMNANGFSSWTPSNGKEYWAIQEYFVDENFLSTDKETRIANRNNDTLLQTDHVWVTGYNRALYAIPFSQDNVTSIPLTKQACVPQMGVHYLYNMTKSSTCDDVVFPWFAIYDDNQLVGMGVILFGKEPKVEGRRDWYERPSRFNAKLTFPNAADCFHDLVGSEGGLSLHTYFVNKPWLITCLKERLSFLD